MKLIPRTLTALLAVQFVASSLAAKTLETYKIDTSHSSVKFSIRHFVAKTTGNFAEFAGTIKVDRENLTNSSVVATIQIASVDTDSSKRDAHLQEEDYFDSKTHPAISFESKEWKATDDENTFIVIGDLSIRGTTKEVDLDVELLGFGEGMEGSVLSGWEIKTLLDRTDFGVDGGQPAVGNEVEVTINIEAIRQ